MTTDLPRGRGTGATPGPRGRTPLAAGPAASWVPLTRPSAEPQPVEGTPSEREAALQRRLDDAVALTRHAYQDTARLVRLLSVLGQPWSPDRLLDETLTALTEVYRAEVTCLTEQQGDRLHLLRACGLAEGDPAFRDGWPATAGAAEVLRDGRPLSREVDPGSEEIPASLRRLGLRSVTWVPMSAGPRAEGLLGVFRGSPDPLTPADLQLLRSVASRLQLAIQAAAHSAAVEDLARVGPRLVRHLRPEPLLKEAAELLRRLTGSESAWVLVEQDGRASVAARTPRSAARPPWPEPDGRTATWFAGRQGQPTQEILADRRGDPRAVLNVPIVRDGACAAILTAVRGGSRPIPKDMVEVASILAGYASAALSNASLYQALGRSEESLRLITDSISDMVTLLDPAGVVRYASPSHERELTLDPAQVVGKELLERVHPEDRSLVQAALADAAGSPRVEYRMWSGRGEWIWVESALRIPETADPGIVVSSRVVEERKRLEQELLNRVTHDSLTGLANRDLATQWIDQALDPGQSGDLGLLFYDLDGFKAVNDRLGHEAGDDLLLQVSERLLQVVREGEQLARFGGDEFVVIVRDVTALRDVRLVGTRVQSAFAEPFTVAGETVLITASAGGVVGRPGATTAGTMLRDADAAMYAAKARGRGMIAVFDEAASKRSLDRLAMRRDLDDALAAGQLALHYQPVVELATGSVRSLEALLRWTHPERGPIPPDLFIPIAEETGSIVPIGRWVLEEACRQLAEWRAVPGLEDLAVSVNLAPVQLLHPLFPTQAVDAVRGAGIPSRAILLEVIERGELPVELARPMGVLRSEGFRLAIDDFGMHNSNLGYLRNFPFDCLKIDRSFVSGLGQQAAGHATDRAIVRAVMAMADTLGLDVVAEGIETEEQRDLLIGLGCRTGQGYLMARPLPAAEATDLLRRQAVPRSRVPEPRPAEGDPVTSPQDRGPR